MKPHLCKSTGYMMIQLYRDGRRKAVTIHRLVALAFINNPMNYQQVNHIDGNKNNNDVTNLEWCTPQYNARHAWDNGLIKAYIRTREYREKRARWASEKFKGVKKTPEHNLKNKIAHQGKIPLSTLTRTRKDCVKILCVDTGEIFLSMKDAADSIGCSKGKFWRHIRNGKAYPFINHQYRIIENGHSNRNRKR